ncbi:hypothetical protein HZ326_17455 [Fusarium oxysporum f. sp. albedinis]|nr:hypothetical protein HZ326_17455 [Fusarium oxysporum f. sp. albedinis]
MFNVFNSTPSIQSGDAVRFNKAAFQHMIVNWIVNTNRSFTTAKDPDPRAIFEYLNPSVSITEAHISDVAVRAIAKREFNANKLAVREALRKSPGQIHIQFDGWRSGTRHALYGVTCIFRNLDNRPQKSVLGLLELLDRHIGENIAEQVLNINNKITMEELGRELGFDWKKRWVRCIGHVVNRVVKHMLFGQDPDAFEQQIYDGQFTAAREHEQWRKRGPVGKWHNFAVSQLSNDPAIQNHGPVGAILDNATHWLSQLAIALRRILLDFQLVAKTLEGDGLGKHQKQGQEDEKRLHGTSWDLLHAYEYLIESLESPKKIAVGLPDSGHLAFNSNLGWIKLDEYYQYLNDSPVIYGAAALHPAYRWALFDDLWGDDAKRRKWIIKTKAIIQNLWECEYKGLFSEDQDSDLPVSKRLKS